jgi:hypothetical protein
MWTDAQPLAGQMKKSQQHSHNVLLTLAYAFLSSLSIILLLLSVLIENYMGTKTRIGTFSFHLGIELLGIAIVFFLIDKLLVRRQENLLATLEAIALRLDRRLNFLLGAEDGRPFNEHMNDAKHVCLLGHTLNRLFKTYDQHFETALQRGAKIQILVLNPGGNGARLVSQRMGRDIRPDIETTLHIARGLRDAAKQRRHGLVQIRTIDWVASCALLFFDPDSEEGRVRITIYPPDISSPVAMRPHFVLSKRSDQRWFDAFYREFSALWNSGTAIH